MTKKNEIFEYSIEVNCGDIKIVKTRYPHEYESQFLKLMPKGEESNLFIHIDNIKCFKWKLTREG